MADSAEGYCVKCKAKRAIKDAQNVTTKNGRKATKGKCTVCGTTVQVMGKHLAGDTGGAAPEIPAVPAPAS